MGRINQLAEALGALNEIHRTISQLLGRSATSGNICEVIASEILYIQLEKRANHPVFDGTFTRGPLQDKTVNVKWRNEVVKTINMKDSNEQPDYFLSLVGPRKSHAKETPYHPFAIEEVCLFETIPLIAFLKKERIKIRHQTRVPAPVWEKARIYPSQEGSPLPLTRTQENLFDIFADLNRRGQGITD